MPICLVSALKGCCWLVPAAVVAVAKFYANGFRLKPKVIYSCQRAPSKMLLHIHYASEFVSLCVCVWVCGRTFEYTLMWAWLALKF